MNISFNIFYFSVPAEANINQLKNIIKITFKSDSKYSNSKEIEVKIKYKKIIETENEIIIINEKNKKETYKKINPGFYINSSLGEFYLQEKKELNKTWTKDIEDNLYKKRNDNMEDFLCFHRYQLEAFLNTANTLKPGEFEEWKEHILLIGKYRAERFAKEHKIEKRV